MKNSIQKTAAFLTKHGVKFEQSEKNIFLENETGDLDLNDKNIKTLPDLSCVLNLQELSLNGNRELSDITAVAALINLKYLGLVNTAVSDISAVAGLIKLKALYLANIDTSELSKKEIGQALPECSIYC